MNTTEAVSIPAVVVQDVSKTYVVGSGRRRRTVEAVRSASLTIPQGSCLAVVGESGSGKTTLARMLVGLESPDDLIADLERGLEAYRNAGGEP